MTLGTNSSTAFPGDRGLNLENRVTSIEEYHNNIPASDVKFNNTNTPLLGANVQAAIENLTQTATQSSDGLLSADDKKRIDNYADLQVIETTLLAANWSGNTAPFIQIITVTDLLSYNSCSVELSPTATPSQTTAATDACITGIQYDESVGLTFTAYGKKPAIDIPIAICVGTSMNVVEVPKYIETPGKAEAISYDSNGSISADNVQDAIDLIGNQLGGTDISAIGDGTVTGAISLQNTNLEKKLSLTGGTITGEILGSSGGHWHPNGNSYINAGGYKDWLTNILDKTVMTDGSHTVVNPVSDLNNFYTGIGIFSIGTNLPSENWYMIISSGTAETRIQIATELFNGTQYHRYCAAGTWSDWNIRVLRNESNRIGNIGFQDGYGLYIYIDGIKHMINID